MPQEAHESKVLEVLHRDKGCLLRGRLGKALECFMELCLGNEQDVGHIGRW
jgi:hypothetical protein